jgi:hypothetical protein
MKAEYGRSGGGVINVVTKSGSNEFHGTVFEFFRDKSLNAETEPEKRSGQGKQDFRRHQFGGALGGPIVEDQAFFFVNFERIVEDISSQLNDGGFVANGGSAALLAANGGVGPIDQPFRRNYLLAKYTQQINPDNRLDVRFGLETNNRDGDQVGEGFTTTASLNYDAIQTNDFYSLLAKHTMTSGTNALNEFVFQWADFENVIVSPLQPDFATPGGPSLFFPSISMGQNGNTPQLTAQQKWQFRDDFSYTLDTHDLKFGGEVMRVAPFKLDVPFETNGLFFYDSDTAPIDGATFFTITGGSGVGQRDNTAYGFYAQDDWRVSDSLTINLGLRYDVEIGTLGDIPFAPETDFLLRQVPGSPWFGHPGISDDKNNWAPRFGFVWDVGARGITAIRGGFGRFYDQVILNSTLFNDLGTNDPPFLLTSVVNPPFGPNNMPSIDELQATYGAAPFTRTVSPDFIFPHTWQGSIGVSHQISPSLAFDADYIHSQADNLSKIGNVNERREDLNGDGSKDNASRVFFPFFGGRQRVIYSGGQDEVDSILLSLRKRMSSNYQLVVNYTYADYRGNAQGLYDAAECWWGCVGDDRDIGPLPNDVRHRFVFGGIFLLPGDWQISPLLQLESARPASRGSDSSQDLNDNGDGGGSGHNVDWAPGPNGEAPGRGNFRGDNVYLLDLRVMKMFTFGTNNLQVMAEFFNLFNRVNWGPNFGFVPEAGNFGQDNGELYVNQFQMQLGVRFTF